MAQVTGYDRHRFQVDRFDQCVDDAHRILMAAADEWSKGHPEEPLTRDVLLKMIDVFVAGRCVDRPYGTRTT